MPISKKQLASKISSDLAHKILQEISWEDYLDFAGSELNPGEQTRIVQNAQKGNDKEVGQLFNRAVGRRIKALADAEADAMVADRTLTETEINRWLGDG